MIAARVGYLPNALVLGATTGHLATQTAAAERQYQTVTAQHALRADHALILSEYGALLPDPDEPEWSRRRVAGWAASLGEALRLTAPGRALAQAVLQAACDLASAKTRPAVHR